MQTRGDRAASERYFLDALERAEALEGPSSRSIARTLFNLGVLYAWQNRFAEAEPTLRRAAAMFEATLGEHHPNVADALNALAGVVQRGDHREDARELLERALAIDEDARPVGHPSTMGVVSNLGTLALDLGDPGEARRWYARGLDELEEAGRGDSYVAAGLLHNVARVDKLAGDLASSWDYDQRALAVLDEVGDPKHDVEISVLLALAESARDCDRFDDARDVLDRLRKLDDWEKSDPSLALEIAISQAIVEARAGRADVARENLRSALARSAGAAIASLRSDAALVLAALERSRGACTAGSHAVESALAVANDTPPREAATARIRAEQAALRECNGERVDDRAAVGLAAAEAWWALAALGTARTWAQWSRDHGADPTTIDGWLRAHAIRCR